MTFKTCPKCGAHLDAGEKCDCEKNKRSCRYCGKEIKEFGIDMCFVCEDHRRDEVMSSVWAQGSEE